MKASVEVLFGLLSSFKSKACCLGLICGRMLEKGAAELCILTDLLTNPVLLLDWASVSACPVYK